MADDSANWNKIFNNGSGKVTIDWTSDSTGGTVAQTSPWPIFGTITRIVTNPGATAPTADYDATITDEDSIDVALGLLANRHTSTTESVYPTQVGSTASTWTGITVAGTLTLNISNAGNSKKGMITIYMR